MGKFKFRKKRFSLKSFGEGWEEAYIDFIPLTIGDIRTKFPAIAKLKDSTDNAEDGMTTITELLKEKFVSGKGCGEDGSLIDISKDDLDEFDSDLLGEAFVFLSPKSPKS